MNAVDEKERLLTGLSSKNIVMGLAAIVGILLNVMYRKFYKLLIIGNSQSTILLIPTGNDGIMEWWNNGIIAFHAIICQYFQREKTPFFHYPNTAKLHHPNLPNPTFQYSNIPSFQSIVSAAN